MAECQHSYMKIERQWQEAKIIELSATFKDVRVLNHMETALVCVRCKEAIFPFRAISLIPESKEEKKESK